MSAVIATYYVAKAGLIFGQNRNVGDPIEATAETAKTCDRLVRTGILTEQPVKPKLITNNSIGKKLTPEQEASLAAAKASHDAALAAATATHAAALEKLKSDHDAAVAEILRSPMPESAPATIVDPASSVSDPAPSAEAPKKTRKPRAPKKSTDAADASASNEGAAEGEAV